jgi:membrane-associated phospholipid phosphatase
MEKIEVRSIVTKENKEALIWLMAGALLLFYMLCGAFYLGEATLLELTPLEKQIPLIPWTIWIYIGLYPFLLWCAYEIDDLRVMDLTLYAFGILVAISCCIFIFFQVTYPRELYPLFYEPSLSLDVFNLIRKIDRPTNCLPSLHVGQCFLLSFSLGKTNRLKGAFGIFSSIIISLSTLTTKQHYIADILAGFLLAILIHLFVFKLFKPIKGQLQQHGLNE